MGSAVCHADEQGAKWLLAFLGYLRRECVASTLVGDNIMVAERVTAMTRCIRCNAPIFWADSINGKKMPMDSHHDPAGTFKLTDRPGSNPLATTVSGPELATAPFLYTCHYAKCPKPVRRIA